MNRPPRSARPSSSAQQRQDQPLPAVPDQSYDQRPTQPSPYPIPGYNDSSRMGAVSFQNPVRPERQRTMPSAYQQGPGYDAETGDVGVGRKKSLVRPDREKIEPGHRQWHYRSHLAQAEDEGQGVGVMPSSMLPPQLCSQPLCADCWAFVRF